MFRLPSPMSYEAERHSREDSGWLDLIEGNIQKGGESESWRNTSKNGTHRMSSLRSARYV